MLIWSLVALSIVGTILNVKHRRSGFVVWMISNTGLASVNAAAGDYAQALLFAVYLVLAVWGWLLWGNCVVVDLEIEPVKGI